MNGRRLLLWSIGTPALSDTKLNLRIASAADQNDSREQVEQTGIRFHGTGAVAGRNVQIDGSGDGPASLGEAGRPYDITVSLSVGTTRLTFQGALVPFDLTTLRGDLTLQGEDLAELNRIVPVKLPSTPAYKVSGRLTRDGPAWAYQRLTMKLDDSDLSGDLSFYPGSAPPKIEAKLHSQRLDLHSLNRSRESDGREKSATVLPDVRIAREMLGKADAQIRYSGDRVLLGRLSFEGLDATVTLKDGTLRLAPLSFDVAGGHVQSTLTLNADETTPQAQVEVEATRLALQDLIPGSERKQVSSPGGAFGAKANLSASGDSTDAMLASGEGHITLLVSGGEIRSRAPSLVNLDLTSAAEALFGKNRTTHLNCAVIAGPVDHGRLALKTFVIDTKRESIKGQGSIDFARERYDVELQARSKSPGVLALRSPLRIEGTFQQPNIHAEAGALLAQAGAALALGALLTPPAALLALVEPGTSGGACGDLMSAAQDAHPAN